MVLLIVAVSCVLGFMSILFWCKGMLKLFEGYPVLSHPVGRSGRFPALPCGLISPTLPAVQSYQSHKKPSEGVPCV